MRFADVLLHPQGGGFNPLDRAILEDPEVEHGSIHHLNQLDDGSIVFLYEFRGDQDRIRDIIDDAVDPLAVSFSGDETSTEAYIHFEPTPLVGAIVDVLQTHEIAVDTPIEFLERGGIRVRLLGADETIRAAVDAVPDDISIELERMGDYHPDNRELFATLTERQQEILRVAVDEGYYAVPREVTLDEIADTFDLSRTTVSEHLRKIESRLLAESVPG